MSTLPAAFGIARLPRIEFGPGGLDRVAEVSARFGRRALLVTGARSFDKAPYGQRLCDALRAQDIGWERLRVAGEPSPELVDQAVSDLAGEGIELVIGVGGGSALDAAKAIAGPG